MLLPLLLLWMPRTILAAYVLRDDYSPSKFLDMFNFFTARDPTNGFVNYVDRSTAQSAGLVQQRGSSVYLGVDSQTMNPADGRMSVRLESYASYDQGLIILDLAHMPGSTCGTWPAFWTVGPNWPSNGEIDIIEGVNSQQSNSMALHTNPGCSINNNFGANPGADDIGAGRRRFSGSIKTPNCDVHAPGQGANVGCAIASADDSTYGDGFNNAGGGIYATEWTGDYISVYHFSRATIPADISSGNPNPSTWGTPLAIFNGCDFRRAVANQTIVLNVSMCGDWAGNVWSSDAVCSQKAATCQDFVANNPSAFANSFWEINSLKVYQQQQDGGYIGPPPPVSQKPPQMSSSAFPSPPQSTPALSSLAASTLVTFPVPNAPSQVPVPTSTMIVTLDMTTTVTMPAQTPLVPGPVDGCHDGVIGGCISRRPGRRPRPRPSPSRGSAAVQPQSGCIGRPGRGCIEA